MGLSDAWIFSLLRQPGAVAVGLGGGGGVDRRRTANRWNPFGTVLVYIH